jgi:hypothetical protein
MHTGIEGGKLKTEALHIPKRLDEEAIPAGTKLYTDNGMYFHFTDAIIYLGSVITTRLRDYKDVAARIIKAYGTIGAQNEFFFSRDVPLDIKLKLYLAILLNTILWGCESWALLDSDAKAIETFHHYSIRQILGISTRRVREERIKNGEVRSLFLNITYISDYITIGKTIQNDNTKATKTVPDCVHPLAETCGGGGQQQTH